MKPILLGLVGRAGSGKDTVGRFIREATLIKGYPWRLLAFADPLKKICAEVFAFSEMQLFGPSEERNRPDPRYPRPDGTCLTPREALQRLGTEFGRACYPNIWVQYGLRRAQTFLQHGANVVFTDCRFVSEAKAIREAGGFVWRIYRPEADSIAAAHQSETEMNSSEMKALITRELFNTGDLAKLKEEVRSALNA